MTDPVMKSLVGGAKGGKAGGGSARVANEAPNTLQSKSVLRAIEFLSEGEIGGLVDGAKSIFFDDTPLQNPDGSFNFSGITYEERKGLPDQDYITGFSSVESEVPVGVKVTQPIPIVRTITDVGTDSVAVTIRLTSLTSQDTSNGDLNGSEVSFKIEYQPSGGSYIEVVSPSQGTITGKTTSPYERQFRFDLTGSAPWNVRVTRVTDDSDQVAVQNDIYFSSYTRIINHKFMWPNVALLGLVVDSSLFGQNVPQRSYEVYGLLLQVPSNYDPETRVYTGVWDGTFQELWSDNPAWVLYALITNKRYGLGNYIDAAEVDKWGLYTIAQYCDELVSDGAGGMEPRYTFNGVIETQEEALRVLQVVASVFRGMLYWGAEGSSGVVTATYDAPQDAVKLFTPANVLKGLFTYSSSAADARHSAAYVTWNNPDNNYEAEIEVVESRDVGSMRVYRTTDVVAYGCTRRSQAHRMGKWILDSELNEDETVTFVTGLADADVRPGQIVKVADPAYSGVDSGGRVLSGAVGSLTVDRPVLIESGQTYSVDVVLPDGTVESRGVTNAPGEYTVLALDSDLSQAPDRFAVWVLTSSDVAPREFRVIGVKENSPSEFEVFAMLYDPTKYARVESDIDLPSPSFTKLDRGAPLPPTNMTLYEYLFSSGPLNRSAVSVSWQASRDSRVVRYELEAKRPGGNNNYELVKVTSGLSHSIEGTIDGLWSFRLRAFDALGTPSPYLELVDQTLNINSRPPDDVATFQVTTVGDFCILSWDPVTSRNLSHYEIRYNSLLTGATWNTSITVVEAIAKGATSVSTVSRTGTFLIKAVSLPTEAYPQGVYSVNALSVSTDLDFLQSFNFVEDLTEDPSFSGSYFQTTLNGGNLELDEVSPGVLYDTGYYDHHDVIDLGDVYTCRVTPHIVASGNLTTNNVDEWENVDLITNVDGVTDGQWAVEVQVSTTLDDTAGSPVWTDYSRLDVGDISARGFRFRTVLWSYFAAVTPSVEELSVRVDMPDLLQAGENLTSDALADTVVAFGFTYKSTRPALVITPQSMQTGDYVDLDPSNIDAGGFTFNIKNATGLRVSRTFDYHAKGYGKITV